MLQSSFKRSAAIRRLTVNVSKKGLRTQAKIRKRYVKDFLYMLDASKLAGSD